MSRHVLALDSSPEYRGVIERLLETDDDFAVTVCAAYCELAAHLEATPPSLLVVNARDVHDGEDGFAVLRQRVDAPIMALVASPEESKAALRGGADYDVPKPFDPEVFLVAVHAVLRRSSPALAQDCLLRSQQPVVLGELRVLPDRRTVERAGHRRQLSPTEWALFAHLLANPGKVMSRRELAAGAWGPGYAARGDQAELYISRVRRKVERDAHHPRLIETVRGRGYRLVPPDAD